MSRVKKEERLIPITIPFELFKGFVAGVKSNEKKERLYRNYVRGYMQKNGTGLELVEVKEKVAWCRVKESEAK